jgi:alpha-tubulin suppressor-like RCC1 family protein
MKRVFSIVFALVLVVGLGLATAVPILADVSPGWTSITQVSAGWGHTVGVGASGTAVAVGSNDDEQCNVGSWSGINRTAAGSKHTVGVESGGTVKAVGSNDAGQCNVGGWTGITQVAAGSYHTVGRKDDGTAVAVGWNDSVVETGYRNYTSGGGQLDVGGWTNIVQVAAGMGHTVGVKSDGAVVAVGGNTSGQCNVTGWTNIMQVAAGAGHTVGLKSDGTVVAVGDNYDGQCNVGNWSSITQVAARGWHTVGLRADGTVVAVGGNPYGQCNVTGWTNIVQVAAGNWHTVGLRSDGAVVAVGRNDYGQCGHIVTETVTNGTVDAKDEADTDAVVAGTARVTVFQYATNPGGSFPTDTIPLDKYIDVFVPDTSQVTEIEIRLYYTDADVAAAGLNETALRLSWWNGNAWVECSDTGVNTASIYGYSGYIWAKIRNNTTPSLAQLQGTEFAGVGYQEPSTPPTGGCGGCFIATAAYGTDTAEELNILRDFRDTILLPNSLGAKFVSFYYRTSPPIADFISQHEVLRTVVRVGFVDPIAKMLKWTHDLWSA